MNSVVANSEAGRRLLAQQGLGFARDCFVKPFPVRCAFEIGTAGLATVVVARVDAHQNAIRNVLYTAQLPLNLAVKNDLRVLEEASKKDLLTKIRLLLDDVQLRRLGVSEYAGLLTWPFSQLADRQTLCDELTKSIKVPFSLPPTHSTAGDSTPAEGAHMARLVFDSYAAAAQVLNKYNFIAISEASTGGIGRAVGGAVTLTGLNPAQGDSAFDEDTGFAAPGSLKRWTSSTAVADDELVEFTIPIGVYHAHRLLITEVQHRNEQQYHPRSSPNPVLRPEFIECREILTKMIAAMLPPWVMEKTKRGCVFAAGSPNGGLFNIAARAAGRTHFSLEALEIAGEHHFSALTDVLIGDNYPNPHLVVPQVALAAGIMRAVDTPRMIYLPDVSLAHSVLTTPDLWAFASKNEIEKKLKADGAWYLKQRGTNEIPQQARDRYSPNNPSEAPATFKSPAARPYVIPEREQFT